MSTANDDLSLELRNVRAGYGGAVALRDVSLRVPAGSVVALLGANGAGKSTTLRCITGQVPLWDGSILFDGERIDGRRPDQALKAGIAHVLEGRQVFAAMTVRENLELGATARARAERSESIDMLFEKFPVLAQKAAQPAGQLSGGQQQMVAIGRAFMSRPRLLLLDEPSLGLAPVMLPVVMDLIKWAQATLGASVLLVEQYSAMAFAVASYGYVLQTGRLVLEGTAQELQQGDALQRAYIAHLETAAEVASGRA